MNNSVLIVGVYLLDKPSYIRQIKSALGKSTRWEIEQRWIGLGTSPVPEELADVTVRKVIPPAMPAPEFIPIAALNFPVLLGPCGWM